MKVCFVTHVADLYGASRSLLRLSSRLARDGHDVEAVLPNDGILATELRNRSVRVTVLHGLPVLRKRVLGSARGWINLFAQTLRTGAQLIRHFRTSRPDVVHTNSAVVPAGALAARVSGVPHVWHVREFLKGESRGWPLYQLLMGMWADRLVCISEAVRGQFNGKTAAKAVVIYNGLPASELSPVEDEKAHLLRAAEGWQGKLVIGLAGRIQLQQKGQDILAKAAALIKERHPESHFVFVGDPFPGNEGHLRALEELVRTLKLDGRVSFLGEQREMGPVYRAAQLWVLPARKPEGLGNVLIEAMARQRPVIGSAIGGIPEVIEDGVNGFLIPPGDFRRLAEILSLVIVEPRIREALGEAGGRRFYERFEFERCYGQILRVYESLRAGTRGACSPAGLGSEAAPRVATPLLGAGLKGG